MDEKILSLPWEIQIALGSGYSAYLIAYVGIRDHHKGVDTAFRALAFGLIATGILSLSAPLSPWLRIAAAFLATVAGGIVWRIWGIQLYWAIIRRLNISWADDTPSAWSTINANNRKHPLTQISVLTDDGVWLNCTQAGKFADAPFGPCILGLTGDVALYVTDEESTDGTSTPCPSVEDSFYGSRLTYVPASRIRRVSLRHTSA